jgi:hypothetical protein
MISPSAFADIQIPLLNPYGLLVGGLLVLLKVNEPI